MRQARGKGASLTPMSTRCCRWSDLDGQRHAINQRWRSPFEPCGWRRTSEVRRASAGDLRSGGVGRCGQPGLGAIWQPSGMDRDRAGERGGGHRALDPGSHCCFDSASLLQRGARTLQADPQAPGSCRCCVFGSTYTCLLGNGTGPRLQSRPRGTLRPALSTQVLSTRSGAASIVCRGRSAP